MSHDQITCIKNESSALKEKIRPMKVLLVYPQFPKTFWGFEYALEFISKKANMPPLGLLTIASMLPKSWSKKVIDLNTSPLRNSDMEWADYVLISAMEIQKQSAREIIDRCNNLGVKTIAGGPLFSSCENEFEDVSHLLIDEGEKTIPAFLSDLEHGIPAHIYRPDGWADISQTPIPSWHLINPHKYACLNIQYSRGCPFDCEFCDITSFFGHVPRTKTAQQIINELDSIYATGWRSGIFFVDDNFIGNKKKLKEEILPVIIQWMTDKNYPFSFLTEASINLADDAILMNLMVQAGFKTVFIGIETVDEDSLAECNKVQNKNRDLLKCVRTIQDVGLQVQGGFIVGFDNDSPQIFRKMIKFIQQSGIVTAMVGLLNAPKRTKLYKRLKDEGRISADFSGNHTDLSINFTPKMDYNELVDGYKEIIHTIYSPKHYYKRVLRFLETFNPVSFGKQRFSAANIGAFFKANFHLGFIGKERKYYWKLFFWSLFKKPSVFPLAISFSIYGFHFRKIFEQNFES